MDIVAKTRTRVMHQIMKALEVGFNINEYGGIELHTPDCIEEVFEWREKSGRYLVSSMITVSVTKTLIDGQGVSL